MARERVLKETLVLARQLPHPSIAMLQASALALSSSLSSAPLGNGVYTLHDASRPNELGGGVGVGGGVARLQRATKQF